MTPHILKKLRFFGLMIVLFSAFTLPSQNASADILSVWLRADGIFLKGTPELDYFSDNKLGPGYGFGAGFEIFFIDFLFDANFFPDGAQFNQLGLGFDIDILPHPKIDISPTLQLLYYFGKFDDGRESIKGINARAGVQVGVNLAKYFWLNLEAFTGYLLTTPDVGAGLAYSGGVNLTMKFDLFSMFFEAAKKHTTKTIKKIFPKKKKKVNPPTKNDDAWTPR